MIASFIFLISLQTVPFGKFKKKNGKAVDIGLTGSTHFRSGVHKSSGWPHRPLH